MELTRPSRRMVMGALTAGSVAGLAGWHLLVRPLPFARPEPVIREMTTLEPGAEQADSLFGSSVSLLNGTLLVGAPKADKSDGRWTGAVAVFERTSDGWARQASLAPEDGQRGAEFGAAVTLAGKTAVVGAPQTNTRQGRNSGTASVFQRTANGWREQTTLTPASGDSNDQFGRTVALSDATALVGAPTDEDPHGDLAGSAVVFTRTDGEWMQQATLTAEDGDGGDVFGRAVALTDDTALVGAPFDEDPHGRAAGAAYVFEHSDGKWTQAAKLTPDDGRAEDRFGGAVAVDDDTALVGAAAGGGPTGSGSGAAYIFARANGEWSQQARLVAKDNGNKAEFGRAVALDGRAALIGAPRATAPDGDRAGSAYLFWRRLGEWPQMSRLLASDGKPFERFGQAVSLDNHRAAIGSGPGQKNEDDGTTGAMYVFDL